jgi:hypothetical protein
VAARTFRNVDVVVGPTSGGYRVRVVASPFDDRPEATFSLDVDAPAIRRMLAATDPMVGSAGPDARRAATTFGGWLFDCVFSGEVGALWQRAVDDVRRHRSGAGVRLRLRFDGAPELEALPWELMYDRSLDTFLSQSGRTPLVRYVEVPATPRPLTVTGALRVLLVLASPSGLPDLDVDRERRAVEDAAEAATGGQLLVDVLPQATLDALDEWLSRQVVHVLHVVAHGDVDGASGAGRILLCDRYGRPAPVTADQLGPRLAQHDPLRLLVLNACHTAGAGDDGGLARGLVRQDVADVVAMQRVVSDSAAATFSRALYGQLGFGIPLDQAVASARVAMADAHTTEWATPVLFMRSPDGRLFRRSSASRTAETPDASQPNDDLDRRRADLESQVALGSVTAAFELANLLSSQSPPDLAGAVVLYRRAVAGGVHGAAGALAYLLVNQMEPPDLVDGRRLLEEAAAAGDDNAANTLGFLLSNRLSPPDLIGARRAYELAMAAGNPWAGNNLGVLLLTQWNPPDRAAALRAFEISAAAGNPKAAENLRNIIGGRLGGL